VFETKRTVNRAARDFARSWKVFRNAFARHCRTCKPARRFGVAAITICCWAGYGSAQPLPSPAAPIKIAVFAFELEDFSAASKDGVAPAATSYLAQATEEAKQQLIASGRYSLVDAAGADLTTAKGQGLRNCGGCEAPIARQLGAEQALIGVVTKISMMEYIVRFQVSDAQDGQVISSFSTDLRMGADYSWSRGVRWLMQNRMLTSN
jgi:Protein of unknown function (DUF2380)